MWTRRESVHRAQLAEHISIYAPQTAEFSERLGATGMPPYQVHAVLERILAGQANMLCHQDVFWLSGCLMIALIPVIWLAPPWASDPVRPLRLPDRLHAGRGDQKRGGSRIRHNAYFRQHLLRRQIP